MVWKSLFRINRSEIDAGFSGIRLQVGKIPHGGLVELRISMLTGGPIAPVNPDNLGFLDYSFSELFLSDQTAAIELLWDHDATQLDDWDEFWFLTWVRKSGQLSETLGYPFRYQKDPPSPPGRALPELKAPKDPLRDFEFQHVAYYSHDDNYIHVRINGQSNFIDLDDFEKPAMSRFPVVVQVKFAEFNGGIDIGQLPLVGRNFDIGSNGRIRGPLIQFLNKELTVSAALTSDYADHYVVDQPSTEWDIDFLKSDGFYETRFRVDHLNLYFRIPDVILKAGTSYWYMNTVNIYFESEDMHGIGMEPIEYSILDLMTSQANAFEMLDVPLPHGEVQKWAHDIGSRATIVATAAPEGYGAEECGKSGYQIALPDGASSIADALLERNVYLAVTEGDPLPGPSNLSVTSGYPVQLATDSAGLSSLDAGWVWIERPVDVIGKINFTGASEFPLGSGLLTVEYTGGFSQDHKAGSDLPDEKLYARDAINKWRLGNNVIRMNNELYFWHGGLNERTKTSEDIYITPSIASRKISDYYATLNTHQDIRSLQLSAIPVTTHIDNLSASACLVNFLHYLCVEPKAQAIDPRFVVTIDVGASQISIAGFITTPNTGLLAPSDPLFNENEDYTATHNRLAQQGDQGRLGQRRFWGSSITANASFSVQLGGDLLDRCIADDIRDISEFQSALSRIEIEDLMKLVRRAKETQGELDYDWAAQQELWAGEPNARPRHEVAWLAISLDPDTPRARYRGPGISPSVPRSPYVEDRRLWINLADPSHAPRVHAYRCAINRLLLGSLSQTLGLRMNSWKGLRMPDPHVDIVLTGRGAMNWVVASAVAETRIGLMPGGLFQLWRAASQNSVLPRIKPMMFYDLLERLLGTMDINDRGLDESQAIMFSKVRTQYKRTLEPWIQQLGLGNGQSRETWLAHGQPLAMKSAPVIGSLVHREFAIKSSLHATSQWLMAFSLVEVSIDRKLEERFDRLDPRCWIRLHAIHQLTMLSEPERASPSRRFLRSLKPTDPACHLILVRTIPKLATLFKGVPDVDSQDSWLTQAEAELAARNALAAINVGNDEMTDVMRALFVGLADVGELSRPIDVTLVGKPSERRYWLRVAGRQSDIEID